ncbi:hypothetical protein TKK_0004861 [Trichogramma kaykai]
MSKNEFSVSYNSSKLLEVFGYMSKDVAWENSHDRREFLYQLDAVIKKWKGQFLNVQAFFRKEVIYWLLLESVMDADEDEIETPGERFIDFVARSGYKDEPDLDQAGEPLLHRTTPLHQAARHGSITVYSLFEIYNGFDVNYIDEDGYTHFHIACQYGLYTIVERFLELGQDPNCFSQETRDARYSETPLNLCLINNHKRVAELLLRRGANPNLWNQNGDAPLHIISEPFDDADDGEFVETFFAINDQVGNTVQVNAQNVQGNTPLLLALKTGNKRAVELLLKRDADPNLANASGFSPVYSIGAIDLAEIFFKINDERNRTIQVNVQNQWNNTPLHLYLAQMIVHKKAIRAAKHLTVQVGVRDNEEATLHLNLATMAGSRKAAEMLLRRGADPNIINDQGDTCLHVICSNDDDEDDGDAANMLFAICDEKHQTVQVDARDNKGRTALHAAIFNGNINLVDILLSRGAHSNLADENGFTPLHVLCQREDDDVNLARRFFEIGEKFNKSILIDARDEYGNTALHQAILNNHVNLVEFLLSKGADPNSLNKDGETTLHRICEANLDDLAVEMLFKICDEKHQSMQVDAQDKMGKTPLHVAITKGNINTIEILMRRGAQPNLADENGFTPLHVLCQRENDDVDLLKMLFEAADKFSAPIKVDARDKSDCTPLHLALNRGHEQMAEWLLRRGADLNLANANGSRALHLISAARMDHADLLRTFFELSDERTQPVEIDARDNQGKTPLHYAISHRHKKVFELLLRRDADPNLADNYGSTALHTICMVDEDNGWAKMLFEISEEMNRQVQIDARGMCDFTPLHHALIKKELRPVAELLLRKGAATNLADWEGSTPLHTVCKYADDEDRVKMLIDISNEENKPVEVDARDTLGRTPLHLALAKGNGQVVKYLLKLGADPALADENGFSPLHVVSKDLYDDAKLLELFCDASKEVDRPVQIDVQDKNGRTPLQWAVTNLFLNVVDVLLDQGADLSSFVFPSKSFFVERFGPISEMHERQRIEFKLSLASKIVDVVKRLEKRGYEFELSNTLDIMSLFAEYDLFDKSTDLEENWYDDEEFVIKSKEIMVNPSLSLHDLIRLRPEEASKQLKHDKYVELARSNKLSDLPESYQKACAVHLCETVSRGFFWPWALDAFYELQHYQLPVLCCEMIIANLKNEDLYNICLAFILAWAKARDDSLVILS